MKKRIVSLFLALAVLSALFAALPLGAVAADVSDPVVIQVGPDAFGVCEDGVMTISGSGIIDGVRTVDVALPTIKTVVIEEGIDGIYLRAFSSFSAMTSVDIPSSVTMISTYAFEDTPLETISVDAANPEFSDIDGVLFDKDGLRLLLCPSGRTGAYSVPDATASIAPAAFLSTSLSGVSIPAATTCIEIPAFSGSGSLLRQIHVDEKNPAYESDENGVLYTKGKDSLIACPGAFEGRLVIPSTVTSLETRAFDGCAGLKSVVIPDGVAFVDSYVFFNCDSLTGVYFLGDAPEIAVYAFYSEKSDGVIPGLTLYYIDGKSGWTTPEWNGYATKMWNGLVDIPENAWYKSAVDYAVENGLMNGMGKGEFRPDDSTTRAMVVTILYRLSGSEETYENPFTDVLDSNWYTDAISWAAHHGIVNGMGNNTFEPETSMRREMLSVILYRYTASKTDADTTDRADLSIYPDAADVSLWAEEAMQWAVANGIVNGNQDSGETYLMPLANATRAQVAAIFQRYIENVLNK